MSTKSELFAAATIAALNILDCEDLTPDERHKADQLYGLASELEEEVAG